MLSLVAVIICIGVVNGEVGAIIEGFLHDASPGEGNADGPHYEHSQGYRANSHINRLLACSRGQELEVAVARDHEDNRHSEDCSKQRDYLVEGGRDHDREDDGEDDEGGAEAVHSPFLGDVAGGTFLKKKVF